jgi:hypothetical protein
MVFVGNPEGKRPLGRPRRRWENIIKVDLKDKRWDGIDSFDLGQGPVEGCCEHGNKLSGFIKY